MATSLSRGNTRVRTTESLPRSGRESSGARFFLTPDYIRSTFPTTIVVTRRMMPAIPQISDAEWEVMKAVWEAAPLTAGEVVERVEAEQKWKPRTVKTLLNRLVKKGAV